jgi:SRSO17 transposase
MTNEQMATLQPALRTYVESFRSCFRKEVTLGYLETYLLGLMSDIPRKRIEPIALAADVPVRTLQEFLSSFCWDHDRAEERLHYRAANRSNTEEGIGVIDGSGHAKQGDKTPGVQRQWCGETGKIDNCIVGQHLLYTDNDAANPFGCVLCSDLYLPESWASAPARRREAHLPDELTYRPKWKIAAEQVTRAIGNGVRFSYLTFDEEYGSVPRFWFDLDRLGQRGVGEVRPNFLCWATLPAYHSSRAEHAPRKVKHLARHSPVFRGQRWSNVSIKNTTRGVMRWKYKAAPAYLTNTAEGKNTPTRRSYWLIWAQSPKTGENKYFVSNAPASVSVKKLLRVAFARWHVEKWFERAKKEAGFGSFEVRTYTGLMRHWLCSRLAMFFLAEQTQRLRGIFEKESADHAGTGRRGGQHAAGEDLAHLATFLDGDFPQQPILSVA